MEEIKLIEINKIHEKINVKMLRYKKKLFSISLNSKSAMFIFLENVFQKKVFSPTNL